MSGLFATFNVAKRGIFVQQKAIDVTSHNISNANTEGYSRQRAIMETTRAFGMSSVNNAVGPGQIGTGSQVTAIQRVRDSFLDYQVRVETSVNGEFQARDKFLTEIEKIVNEPSDTAISDVMGKFFDSWHELSKQAQSSNARTVVVQQAQSLADLINHNYNQLQKLKDNTQAVIKDSIFEVNDILSQLDTVNQQVINVNVVGQMPNDLMDRRDLLLDKLSSKFGIKVDDKNFEGIDVHIITDSTDSKYNPPLANTARLDSGEAKEAYLLKSKYNENVNRISFVSGIELKAGEETKAPTESRTYKVTYYKLGDMADAKNAVTIEVNMTDKQYKELDECRSLWAYGGKDSDGNPIKDAKGLSMAGVAVGSDGKPLPVEGAVDFDKLKLFKSNSGEMKGYMSVQGDIDDYVDQLNKLAKALAFAVNAVHSGKADAADDKEAFFVVKGTTDASQEASIDAGNISVNRNLINDVMKIKTRTNDYKYDHASENIQDGEIDGERAKAIAGLRDKLLKIQDIGITINSRSDLVRAADPNVDGDLGGPNKLMDKGLGIESNVNGMRTDNYFKDTVDRLGIQEQEARRMVKNQEALLTSFQESRDSVAGVSLDEEMANMVQYQHAYQANAKMISVVDQLLEVIVNGLVK